MSKKFVIKNVNKDLWATFLFNELRKDEKRPTGNNWLAVKDILKVANKKTTYYSLRIMMAELIQKGECEQYAGSVRSEKGTVIKAVWYRHKSYSWKDFFNKNIYKKERQRMPEGKNWFTAQDLCKKTGFGKAKILRLIKEHKISKKIKIFDGYRFNPQRNYLERKIWYKLCQNG